MLTVCTSRQTVAIAEKAVVMLTRTVKQKSANEHISASLIYFLRNSAYTPPT